MSKPVRIKEFVAAQVELVAGSERRSFANMVEVLLLAALTERGDLVGASPKAVEPTLTVNGPSGAYPEGNDGSGLPRSASAVTPNGQNEGVRSRPHMKRHRPAVECPTRWPSGVCPDCGTVV